MDLEARHLAQADGWVVRDLQTGEHLTFIVEEQVARVLAEAERALGLCRDLAALIPEPAEHTLAWQARQIVARATQEERVFEVGSNDVVIIGGDDEADQG